MIILRYSAILLSLFIYTKVSFAEQMGIPVDRVGNDELKAKYSDIITTMQLEAIKANRTNNNSDVAKVTQNSDIDATHEELINHISTMLELNDEQLALLNEDVIEDMLYAANNDAEEADTSSLIFFEEALDEEQRATFEEIKKVISMHETTFNNNKASNLENNDFIIDSTEEGDLIARQRGEKLKTPDEDKIIEDPQASVKKENIRKRK